MRLSIRAARTVMLAAQGLAHEPTAQATKDDVLAAIRRMAVLQIDTINVVARSPYLVLWSRLGDYDPRWLDELLAEGALFEYWAHAACFIPIEDFPLYRRVMLERWPRQKEWLETHPEEVAVILDRIREAGPVRSADFTRTDGQKGGWWNWKIEKEILERLFNTGELMIARRERFQRIYDLRERVLPDWDDANIATETVMRRERYAQAVRALGITSARWAANYFYQPLTGATKHLDALLAEGRVITVEIEDMREPMFVHRDHAALLDAAAAGTLEPSGTTLLSPFDPLIFDRARALSFFDFDYRIECYTPEAKRRYGYFSLGILHRGALVGRLDPKAHRKDGIFEIKAIYLEPGVEITDDLIIGLVRAMRRCASWHQTPEIIIRRSEPAALAVKLTAALRKRPAKVTKTIPSTANIVP